jgi:tetratricopeptide (TPR) repeat protein
MRGAFLLWTVGIAFGQQAVWEKHTREGDRLAQAGRYREAKAVYQLALRGEDMPADPGVQASMWNNLAMINRVLGNLVEARPQYQRALELMGKARGPGNSAYAGILHNLAVLDYTAGNLGSRPSIPPRLEDS